jgi:hypothetical protein
VAAARRVLFSREGGRTGGYLLQHLGELVRRDDSQVEVAEDLLLTKFSQDIPRVPLGTWWSPDQAAMKGLQRERKGRNGVDAQTHSSHVQVILGASLGHAARSCGTNGQAHHHNLVSTLRAPHTSKMIARHVLLCIASMRG